MSDSPETFIPNLDNLNTETKKRLERILTVDSRGVMTSNTAVYREARKILEARAIPIIEINLSDDNFDALDVLDTAFAEIVPPDKITELKKETWQGRGWCDTLYTDSYFLSARPDHLGLFITIPENLDSKGNSYQDFADVVRSLAQKVDNNIQVVLLSPNLEQAGSEMSRFLVGVDVQY